MLLDKVTSASTLYLTIGLNRVDYGVFAAGAWVENSIASIRVDANVDASDTEASAVFKLTSAISKVMLDVESKLQKSSLAKIEHLRVLVADTWLPSTLIPWNASAGNEQLFALSQLSYAGFDVEERHTVKFVELGYKKPSLAIAYPDALLASLTVIAEKLALRLTSVLPVSVAGLKLAQSKMAKVAVLGIYTHNLLTIIDENNGLLEVKTRILANDDNQLEMVASEWNRIKLREGHLTGISKLPLLDLTAERTKSKPSVNGLEIANSAFANQHKNISGSLNLALEAKSVRLSADAITQGYVLSKLNWIAIVLLLTLITILGAQVWKLNQQADAVTAEINSAKATGYEEPIDETWTKQEIKQAQAINTTIRQLNLPFSTFMEALQPPEDIRVAILSLDLDATAKTAHIKMVAEAKTTGEMAQYISFLAQRKIFSDVFLLSHERIETTPEHPYRFNLELRWEDAS